MPRSFEDCVSCLYWEGSRESGVGVCQRHCPVIGPMGAAWPPTDAMEWCGDFEQKEEQGDG